MQTHYSSELIRRCEQRQLCTATTTAAGVIGLAIDAGIVSLPAVLDLVRSCSDANELGDALTMLAATVPTADLQPVGGA